MELLSEAETWVAISFIGFVALILYYKVPGKVTGALDDRADRIRVELEERLPIPGRVIWVTPPGAQGNRRPGIGVQFGDTSDGAHARTIIESHLAQLMKSDKRTHTM